MIKTRYSAANYKRLLPFLDAVDKTENHYFRFTAGEYEPLPIENLGYTFNGCPVYSMMHTYVQNGDIMRDPDMTFYVDRENGHVIPMTFQQDGVPFGQFGTLYQEVWQDANYYRPKLLHELDRFLNTWSKNIIDQGFDSAQASAAAPADAPDPGADGAPAPGIAPAVQDAPTEYTLEEFAAVLARFST